MKFIRFAWAALICLKPMLNAEEADLEKKFSQIAKEPGSVAFTPPKGWRLVDQNKLPKSILAMVIGEGDSNFPPSINLGVHQNSGTLSQFLKFVKKTNESDGIDWKDLGTISTGAGDASLSQLSTKTEWGSIREMQVIFVKDDTAYILTAAALESEFPKFYKDFFSSMRSLRINKDMFEAIPDRKRRDLLKNASEEVANIWKRELKNSKNNSAASVFESDEFQTKAWKPFIAKLELNFSDMNEEWRNHFIDHIKTGLK